MGRGRRVGPARTPVLTRSQRHFGQSHRKANSSNQKTQTAMGLGSHRHSPKAPTHHRAISGRPAEPSSLQWPRTPTEATIQKPPHNSTQTVRCPSTIGIRARIILNVRTQIATKKIPSFSFPLMRIVLILSGVSAQSPWMGAHGLTTKTVPIGFQGWKN
jgi:hypothetical protein